MNNLNSILIEGNLVRDPEMKTTPKGTPLCKFSVASNRFHRSGDGFEKEVSFFDIESWNALATTCGENLHKGRGVRVVGRLKQDRWTGTDGKSYNKVMIVADHVELKPVFRSQEEERADNEKARERFLDGNTMPGTDIDGGQDLKSAVAF